MIGQSRDLEIIEINMPADYMTAQCEVGRLTDWFMPTAFQLLPDGAVLNGKYRH